LQPLSARAQSAPRSTRSTAWQARRGLRSSSASEGRPRLRAVSGPAGTACHGDSHQPGHCGRDGDKLRIDTEADRPSESPDWLQSTFAAGPSFGIIPGASPVPQYWSSRRSRFWLRSKTVWPRPLPLMGRSARNDGDLPTEMTCDTFALRHRTTVTHPNQPCGASGGKPSWSSVHPKSHDQHRALKRFTGCAPRRERKPFRAKRRMRAVSGR
jgi:hypothetical protein